MRIGQLFAIVGAFFVFIGLGLFNPIFAGMFDGLVVPMFELEVAEMFIHGWNWQAEGATIFSAWHLPILQTTAIFSLIAAGIAVVAFFLRRFRKYLAALNVIFAVTVFGVMAYVHTHATAVIEAAAGQALFRGESIVTLEGPFFVYGGALMILLSSLIVFAARPVWRKSDRFLRVALLWNGAIIKEEVFFDPTNVTVGEDAGSTFVLPTASVGGMPQRIQLFKKDVKGRYELSLMPQMTGNIHLDDQSMAIADYLAKHAAGAADHQVPVESGDWGILNIGDMSLFFQFVPPEAPVKRKAVAALPWDLAATTTLSAVVQVAFILTTLFLWQEKAVRTKRKDTRKKMLVDVQTKIEEEEEELLDTGEEEDTTGKKAEGEEGTFGDPDVDPEIESRVPKRDGEMVARIDPKKVGLNDLLSTSALGGRGAISNILSRNTAGFSNKLAIAMSGTGSEFLMGHGSGGLGFQGTGTGGGGTGGYGRIHGLGRIDTGGGVGMRARMGRKKARRVGRLRLGGGASKGFCSRTDIAKNVRMRAGAIRACYERQLQVKPSLAGKVTIQWTIKLTGGVGNAHVQASTLRNQAVENCILRAVRRIRFKKPEGGICIVKWPFVFNPG